MLKKKSVYVIDDTETFGKGVADAFDAEFVKRGGTVVKHDAAPKTTQDYVSIMTAAKALNPESIYFGGVTATGGARILLAAQQAGLGDVPYVGPDGINDGSGETKDSFLNLAAAAAKNSYSTLAGIGDFPGKAQFDTDYKAEYGIDATGYAGMGYACAQVVIDALKRAGETNPADMTALREAVRVAGTDTDRHVQDHPRRHHVQRGRRHQPEDRLDLLGRPCRRKRQGRLEVRDPGRLRRAVDRR